MNDYVEEYAEYEAQFDPMLTDRQARRKRKPKVHHTPKKSDAEILAGLTNDLSELEGGFEITYKPARYERIWLLDSLKPFYDLGYIVDVLAQIKGGKEASVYRCRLQPEFAEANGITSQLLAAKVYRPRQFRNLRNDAAYREGRRNLSATGSTIKENESRVMRALAKGSSYGSQVAHVSWLMHEYTTLERLYKIGAAVPKPVAVSENSILMGYCGNEWLAASALNEIGLGEDEALPLFNEVMRNVELMLKNDMIHGDLSAYNILYWEGDVTLIDFPQVTNSKGNRQAYNILQRDITRVCEYFQHQGVARDADEITDRLWKKYAALHPKDRAATEDALARRVFGIGVEEDERG